jgi:hypothetical protein
MSAYLFIANVVCSLKGKVCTKPRRGQVLGWRRFGTTGKLWKARGGSISCQRKEEGGWMDGWMDGWRDERFEVQQGGCGFWILDKQNKTKILTQLAFVTWFLFQSLLAIFLREFSFKRACQLRQVMPKSGKKPIFRRESRLA